MKDRIFNGVINSPAGQLKELAEKFLAYHFLYYYEGCSAGLRTEPKLQGRYSTSVLNFCTEPCSFFQSILQGKYFTNFLSFCLKPCSFFQNPKLRGIFTINVFNYVIYSRSFFSIYAAERMFHNAFNFIHFRSFFQSILRAYIFRSISYQSCSPAVFSNHTARISLFDCLSNEKTKKQIFLILAVFLESYRKAFSFCISFFKHLFHSLRFFEFIHYNIYSFIVL